MKSGMPKVVMRYPGRLTAVRNSNVATVHVFCQLVQCPIRPALPARRAERCLPSAPASARTDRCAPARTSAASASCRRTAVSQHQPPRPFPFVDRAGHSRNGRQRAARVNANFRQRMVAADLVDLAIDHQSAAIDHGDAIAERLDLVHLVGREDRRAAVSPPLLRAAAARAARLPDPAPSSARRGRRVRDRSAARRDLHFLRHPLAEAIDLPARDLRQFDPLEPHAPIGASPRRG